jgi:DNA-binding SARP family transcriptional activator/tetratricopeptide (TPR) repeat protein
MTSGGAVSRLEYGLLGPVEVWLDGRVLELGPPRQRAVLAVLLSKLDAPMPVSDLVDRIWEHRAPATGADLVYGYVSRLRRVLAPAVRVVRERGGYRIDTDPENVDMHRFRRLVAAAAVAGNDDAARQLLGQALGNWRGRPFGDLGGPWLEQLRTVLERERFAATLDHNDLEIRCGRYVAVLPRLEELAASEPLDERLAAQLMLARHRNGRRADALGFYVAFRRRLAEELGADPGPKLVAVHQAILRGDPEPGAHLGPQAAHPPGRAQGRPPVRPPVRPSPQADQPDRAAPGATAAPEEPARRPARPVVPAQLPAAVAAFTGRRAELAALDIMLTPALASALAAALAPVPTRTPEDGAVVVVVSGTAGVGKTALAVHWAHQAADRFPDGQLYVNLRGYDPGQPVAAAEALAGFLRALRVPTQDIPLTVDERAAAYRTLLAERRMLILLDNASSADQVRPLLPGAGGCRVVVTSRDALGSLVANEGARPLVLGLLSNVEAHQLLSRRLGADRVAAELAAVQQIIGRCARLPLALAVVAAGAATHPDFPLGTVADGLGDAAGALDVLDGGDPASDVRAVFSWSYQALSPAAARLFRLLGLHPGPDFGAPAAASQAGLPVAQVRRPLTELTRAHLLTEHSPGRYAFHDLLRAYAAEQAMRLDTVAERHAAAQRVLDHYVHTAYAAASVLYPYRDPLELTPPQPGVQPQPMPDSGQALRWFTAERAVLVAAVQLAAGTGYDSHAWQLSRSVVNFLDGRGHWHDSAACQHAALAAATRLGHRHAEADAHRLLARVYTETGRLADAQEHLGQALRLYEQLGDGTGQAHSHHYLAAVWERQGRHTEALPHAHRALELYRSAGHRAGQAAALNAAGWCHAQLGDYQQALEHCREALEVQEQIGDSFGEADTLDTIGYAHHHLGDLTQALRCYERALALHRKSGEYRRQAETLSHLGDTHRAASNTEAARRVWQRALAILDELSHPDADEVRAKLTPLLRPDRTAASG